MRASLLAAVAVVIVGFTGCGNEGAVGGSLRERTFLSTQVTEDGNDKRLASNSRVRMQFTDDGRLIADAGCNTMQGPVDTSDGKIAVKDLAITEMGCAPELMGQDTWLATLLSGEPAWRLEGDTLTVSTDRTVVVLQDRRTVEPDLPLEGTRWTVDTLIQGEVVSHGADMAKAYLVFSGGKVNGSTGCNSLNGPATVSGTTIEFGPIATTRRACPGDAAALERAMLEVLSGPVSFTIESSRLTLHKGSDGLGLTGR